MTFLPLNVNRASSSNAPRGLRMLSQAKCAFQALCSPDVSTNTPIVTNILLRHFSASLLCDATRHTPAEQTWRVKVLHFCAYCTIKHVTYNACKTGTNFHKLWQYATQY